eukprot:Protomagalhaensia_sp_Gyna_25__40@NODE_101_length_5263_cov_71_008806_g78_i0_p3_GENE_NODE_101_length_5263_cov_71_008806_g78_i0NODE_101_length_5263_cov_71_008806_g78_i0_p3_ORF_typecomplete_len213_score37_51zfCCCH_3/PF15663_5/1_2e09zf_CCCH_4/PF18345_1/7_2e09zf_CCCH_4/PF18345_1/3_6e03zf_CCCH_4/PF18345_1/1_5e03zfCCCH/PF00642_24/1_9e05zfCCCH/PF00642_24/0_045zfCCCH_4/PF18044_1/2_2e06zfCCCH_4/PF18044_1/5_6e02zfCCCH_4/PF18044_1/6_2e03zfCCCH_2/PF14608_6/0_00014zfCCCH_2/PF14608_6/49Torus/PF16131_5/0_0038Tor
MAHTAVDLASLLGQIANAEDATLRRLLLGDTFATFLPDEEEEGVAITTAHEEEDNDFSSVDLSVLRMVDDEEPLSPVPSQSADHKEPIDAPSDPKLALLGSLFAPATLLRTPDEVSKATQQQSARAMSFQKAQCFKTRQCRFWLDGRCTRGEDCTFAHCGTELREKPNLLKTKICTKWRQGHCFKPQAECSYAHGIQDLRVPPSPPFPDLPF